MLVAVLCLVLFWFFWYRAKIELFSDMKTIFICTHCVLILTLITLTLLLINSALSLADSVDDDVQNGQLTNQIRKASSSSFQEDTNHYSAAISSSASDSTFNTFQTSTVDKSNDKLIDKLIDKSSANEDDQLSNWDNVYDSSFVNNANNPSPTAGSTRPETANKEPPANRDELAKLNPPIKLEKPANKRYLACSRDFGNITVKNKTAGDNGFKIKITGNPEKYTPGELYTGKFLRKQKTFLLFVARAQHVKCRTFFTFIK